MRTWVLETAGLGSFPNIPTHHIPIPVEKALGNPYPGSSVRIHKGKTLCYMHCSNLIQPSTNFDLYQRLLSSLVPFNPYHHPIFTQQLNENLIISLLSLKLSIYNYFISIHCYPLIKPMTLSLWSVFRSLLYLDCTASDIQYLIMVFSETSDWISSLTYNYCFVFYEFTNRGFFLIFWVIINF